MRRFFAPPEQISKDRVTLEEDETRHLRDVLRLRIGDTANVFDGGGAEYACSVTSIGKRSSELDVIEPITPAAPESPLDLTMAVAVLKGDKFDLVVQKLVELGANAIIPLITARTETDIRGVSKRLTRWSRIALEATKQCGRARLTRILDARTFEDMLGRPPRAPTVLFAEREGRSFSELEPDAAITAVVGPEGGWDDDELNNARRSNIPIVTFGGRILRAETAAISIAAVLQHRFGDLN